MSKNRSRDQVVRSSIRRLVLDLLDIPPKGLPPRAIVPLGRVSEVLLRKIVPARTGGDLIWGRCDMEAVGLGLGKPRLILEKSRGPIWICFAVGVIRRVRHFRVSREAGWSDGSIQILSAIDMRVHTISQSRRCRRIGRGSRTRPWRPRMKSGVTCAPHGNISHLGLRIRRVVVIEGAEFDVLSRLRLQAMTIPCPVVVSTLAQKFNIFFA